MPLGTTDIINFFILYFSYLIKICSFENLLIFTHISLARKISKFDVENEKISLLNTSNIPLQKLLMTFFDTTNFYFWTFWTRRFHSGPVCRGPEDGRYIEWLFLPFLANTYPYQQFFISAIHNLGIFIFACLTYFATPGSYLMQSTCGRQNCKFRG